MSDLIQIAVLVRCCLLLGVACVFRMFAEKSKLILPSSILILLACLACSALAGQLTQPELDARLMAPLHVSEKLHDIPAWPIVNQTTPDAGPVGYMFESIDLAPIPGFAGSPLNLLISINAKGDFLNVEVLQQHEPMFVDGLGLEPLNAFVAKYKGHNLRQRIGIGVPLGNQVAKEDGTHVILDGVSKATVSIRIVNQTIITSALAVARSRLGIFSSTGRAASSKVRQDLQESKDFARLLADGDIVQQRWSNRDIETLFTGSAAEGLDAAAELGDSFVDLFVGYISAPTLGKVLLGEGGYRSLMNDLEPGQEVYWVATSGRYSFIDRGFIPQTSPRRLTATQDGIPVELRDTGLELRQIPGAPGFNGSLALKSPLSSGLDPARSIRIGLDVVRVKTAALIGIPAVIVQKMVTLDYRPPSRYFVETQSFQPDWLIAWMALLPQLTIIAIALIGLGVVLARPRWMVGNARRRSAFRAGYLVFTLFFIGGYAQGQLSIVQITGVVTALVAARGLGNLLYDPVSILIFGFTGIGFFVWGRGVFCGWLCPFGALQEFVALLGRATGLRNRQIPSTLGRFLVRARYGVLITLLFGAAFFPEVSERLAEVEPFKTSVSMGFNRDWPYVVYVFGLLIAGAIYYKFFCRFVCPLGAVMVLGGKLRCCDWLIRRKECGQPCQTCRHRCNYDAINRDGSIRYDECFQCLDCVGIYHSPQRCAPLLLQARKEVRRLVAT